MYVDCKTVGFFFKISKGIGKAWRKSLTRAKRASLTRPWGFLLAVGDLGTRLACEAREKKPFVCLLART